MSEYKFYAGYLSFVANRTTPTTAEIRQMMEVLDDIAEILNVSGERVRQLEALGLRKLRAVVMNNGKLDFRNLDKLVGIELRGKTKMSPLQLSLILDNAA